MKRKYDDKFKRNAVNKVFDGQSVRSVSQELGAGEFLTHKWKRTFRQTATGGSGLKVMPGK